MLTVCHYPKFVSTFTFLLQAEADISNRKKKIGEQESTIKDQNDRHNELLQNCKALERQVSEKVCKHQSS